MLKKIFHPVVWLTGFAILHTVMFLVPQLLVTGMAAEMAWGEGNVPDHALFYEFQLGALGIGYTPMLLGIAFLARGVTRAKLTIVTAIGMGLVASVNTYANLNKEGYLDDMGVMFMVGLPVVIMGGLLLSGLLHLQQDSE